MNKQVLLQQLNLTSLVKSRLFVGIFVFVVFLFPQSSVFAQSYESYNPTGFVNDYSSVLSTQEKTTLENLLSSFKTNTGNEIVVAIIPTLDGDYIENFALKLFEKWGIGEKEKDTGALLLVSIAERELRIEVGYGLEEFITDSEANIIINRYIVPEFKNGNYYAGISSGVDQILKQIQTNEVLEEKPVNNFRFNPELIIFLFFFFGSIFASTKSWWLGGVVGFIAGIFLSFLVTGSLFKIITVFVTTIILLLIDYAVSKNAGNRRGGGPFFFGGSGSGSGFGGGSSFGGFGGGMSGGGGSSGRW